MPDDTPVVIHVRDMRPGDVYIGRAWYLRGLAASKWRNPYKVGLHGNREGVLALYDYEMRRNRPDLVADLRELAGKRLACWCAKPGQTLTADDPLRCHGQIIARLYREVCDAN